MTIPVTTRKSSKARRQSSRTGPLDRLSLDELFAEARQAYAHLPAPRRRRLIARLIRAHVLTRLRRASVAGGGR